MDRHISWVKPALKAFAEFPYDVQRIMARALEIAADGEMADIAKPMKGLGSGVYEIALCHRGDAYRAIYAVKIGNDLWVVHAFQKKSTQGIKTPVHEIDLVRQRLKQLRSTL